MFVLKYVPTKVDELQRISGARSPEQWERTAWAARLTLERVLLGPVLSTIMTRAMHANRDADCRILEKMTILRASKHLEQDMGIPEILWSTKPRPSTNPSTSTSTSPGSPGGASSLARVDSMGSQEGGGEGGGRRSSLDDGPVTAAFWTASIELLNVVDNISMPSEKLRVLIRVVESIFAEAGRRGCPGLGADDFFPIFTLVIIRANLRHPQTTVSACALSGALLVPCVCFGVFTSGWALHHFVPSFLVYSLR